MARLINTVTMTTDGVTDVGECYVAEGGQARASAVSMIVTGQSTRKPQRRSLYP